VSLGACAVALTLWSPPVELSRAEEAAPSTSACPPSPTFLAGSTPATSTAPAATRSTSPYQPSAAEVVACVGSQEIDGATFAHWAVVAGKTEPRSHRHPLVEPTRAEMTQVMGFLISAEWVTGEAAALHIDLSPATVRRRFDQLSRQQFSKPARFRAFLRSTGQTLGDLLFRVRLSMLTTRIQTQVAGHGSARAKQRRLERFLGQFKSKWEAQTYCESLYATPNCGHTASSL
jgi:hypothetical protein